MSKLAFTGQAQIISLGGPVTKATFKPASSVSWNRGTLLKLTTNNQVTPCLDPTGGAATLDTDDTGTANARLFIALAPYGSLATSQNSPLNGTGYPSDGYVEVQEIYRSTVLELLCADSAASDASAAIANVDGTYAAYQLADGSWACDLGNTTKPILRVLEVQPEYNPHALGAADDYNRVRCAIVSGILQR